MKNYICLIVLMISGCTSPDIENTILNDRVKACSAGFSVETQSSLHASLEKVKLKGDINADIKQETRSVIFSQMPDQYRLAAYKNYIKCIEKNWNHE